MKKLHVLTVSGWKMVFCAIDAKVVTTENKQKSLPTKACWAEDDLQYFRSKFGNMQFCLMVPSK